MTSPNPKPSKPVVKATAAHGSISRRRFVQSTAAASIFLPYFSWNAPASAWPMKNDRLQIGCIGLGGMGMGDAADSVNQGVDIVAVCDVDLRHAERAKNDENVGKGKAEVYQNYRRLLEREDIQAVNIVTPDHWHVLIAIEALQAGKHVFCQKPLTLTLEENKLIRAACQKHPNLVFGVGTQQRSESNLFMRAVNMVRQGLLGDIKRIVVGIDGSPAGGPFPVSDVPQELDWDLWLGQAPKVDYRSERCHGNFRWWYEYSGGKFTDWGAHHVDIAFWATGNDKAGTGPIEIDGSDAKHPVEFKDGQPVVDDSYNTSHDFSVKCKFADGMIVDVTSRSDNGVLFEGTKGRIFVNRSKIVGKPIEENWDEGKYGDAERQALFNDKPHEWHKTNFFRCVREGGMPVSDVYSHVQTMNTCHLVGIAARLGRTIKWDPAKEEIVGDDQAKAMMARTQRSGFEIPSL